MMSAPASYQIMNGHNQVGLQLQLQLQLQSKRQEIML